MAATAVISDRNISLGKYKGTLCTVTMDSSYDAGGESITGFPNSVGLARVVGCIVLGSGTGYFGQWNNTTNKMMAFYGDFDAVADGALIEATSANLSAVVFTVIFLGVV